MKSSQYISWTFINHTIQENLQIWNVYIIYVEIKTVGSERSVWTNEDKLLNAYWDQF